jgi:hypothetical protein
MDAQREDAKLPGGIAIMGELCAAPTRVLRKHPQL